MATGLPQSVVVYDGECRFCRQQITRIQGWDRQHRFEYLPRQTPGIEDRYPLLAQGDFNTGMRLIMPDGDIHVGADAVYHIALGLPRWRWIAWIYRVPLLHGLAKRLYAWIAARRQSLGKSCDDNTCEIGR